MEIDNQGVEHKANHRDSSLIVHSAGIDSIEREEGEAS